jgi:hypothetical protein
MSSCFVGAMFRADSSEPLCVDAFCSISSMTQMIRFSLFFLFLGGNGADTTQTICSVAARDYGCCTDCSLVC